MDDVIRAYLDGMLKTVLARMSPVRNVTSCIALFAFSGLTAGVAVAVFLPRYDVGAGLMLPAHSPYSAAYLVRMTRGDNPGVRIDAYRRSIGFSATGTLSGADRAVGAAIRQVIALNDGKYKRTEPGLAMRQQNEGVYGLFGFLAGLGTALGFLMPPRSRVTATACADSPTSGVDFRLASRLA